VIIFSALCVSVVNFQKLMSNQIPDKKMAQF